MNFDSYRKNWNMRSAYLLLIQTPSFFQSKLACCVKGVVIDVVIDIRMCSPTYGLLVVVKRTENNPSSQEVLHMALPY